MMRSAPVLLTSVLLAAWIAIAAIVAVQNFSPVSFRLFQWQSIQMPVGLVLAFSAGIGAIGTALVLPLATSTDNSEDFDDDD